MEEARFSVAQFNNVINSTLSAIGDVVVEGEITQLNITARGGVNIVLKDPKENAILNISGYAPQIEGVFLVKTGMKVAAFGVPNLWSSGGRFTLKIDKIIPLGEGALKEAYEKLKQFLTEQGLFAVERKRPLPELVFKIALLTGRDSAAQSDFLKILKENNVGIEIDFYPVQVQGKYSEEEILNTLKFVDKKNEYDCVALVRGGGSLEDLITFNSEKIARQIFAMSIPLIVGVGHEKDESIADFVADIRASTPSQAAYYLVINNENFIKGQEMKLDVIYEALEEKLSNSLINIDSKISNISQKLMLFVGQIDKKVMQIGFLIANFPMQVEKLLTSVENLEKLFLSYNPKNVLDKGYAYVSGEQGQVMTDIENFSIDQKINVNLKSGSLLTNILKITKKNHEKGRKYQR